MEEAIAMAKSLAKLFKYQKLVAPYDKQAKDVYTKAIPSWVIISGERTLLSSETHVLYAVGYSRVVVGDYVAFLELDVGDVVSAVLMRVPDVTGNSRSVSKFRLLDGSGPTLLLQERKVSYADFIVGKYYISLTDRGLQEPTD